MDYYEMKLRQRFEPSGVTRNTQSEEDAFYASFAERCALYTRLLEKLAFRANTRDTAVATSSQPLIRKTIG
ncbi:MAG: hypothetical protein HKN43_07615 [Rhodothermales bacterium]|nr:hypothetical protein [Rhodothermales bacterium]